MYASTGHLDAVLAAMAGPQARPRPDQVEAVSALVDDRRIRELVITKVDGGPVGESPFRERLVAAGFSAGYRGLVLRAGR